MSMNNTPAANRVHIGIFGKRNAGKSSLINAITAQDLAIVSEQAGTTTDPVSKSMEILPIGPVVLIDTPGLDDIGELGEKRVKKSYDVLNKTDIALLVVEYPQELDAEDKALLEKLKEKKIPYLIVRNKADLFENEENSLSENEFIVSAKTGLQIQELKEHMAKLLPQKKEKPLVRDLVNKGDMVLLVVPIDSAAPKGRLILPQQQVIRDLLDGGMITMVVKDKELKETVEKFSKQIKLVVTDSQAFGFVNKTIPKEMPLTSFSILFARYKGSLASALKGIRAIENLQESDKVLVCEGCTHHRQCDDIGTVKIPKWLSEYTKKNLQLFFSSGTGFPEDLQEYSLIIHCGSCMLNEKEVQHRVQRAEQADVPMTNYGLFIAYVNGILKRSLEPFAGQAEFML